jgi:hypothetical protein
VPFFSHITSLELTPISHGYLDHKASNQPDFSLVEAPIVRVGSVLKVVEGGGMCSKVPSPHMM